MNGCDLKLQSLWQSVAQQQNTDTDSGEGAGKVLLEGDVWVKNTREKGNQAEGAASEAEGI